MCFAMHAFFNKSLAYFDKIIYLVLQNYLFREISFSLCCLYHGLKIMQLIFNSNS